MAVKRSCKICAHKKRAAIEKALAAPEASHRAIAKRFSLCARTVDRHKRDCLPAALIEAVARAADTDVTTAEKAIGSDLIYAMEGLQTTTLAILAAATAKNAAGILAPQLALKAIQQARHNYTLLARLTGKLDGAAAAGDRLVTFEEFTVLYRRVTAPATVL